MILYLAPAMIFTLGWALGELWTPFGPHWRPILAGLFFFHLVTGIGLLLILSRGAQTLPREQIQKRALISLGHIFAGYVWIVVYTIYTNMIAFHTDRPLLDQLKHPSTARTAYCLIILIYINIVFLLYRKIPAYRLEGGLGVIELLLWTGLISLTGGFQSQFLYLYFLTLSPAFRRGIPDATGIRYRVRVREPLWSVIYRKHNRRWIGAVLYPFCWFAAAVALAGLLYLTGGPLGSYQTVRLSSWWPISYLLILGYFYLHCAPWLLLSVIMAVTVEIETDRLRTLSKLMEMRANANWNEDLEEVVAELGLAIKSNSTFRCSGVLATTVSVSRVSTAGDSRKTELRDYQFCEAFQIDDIDSIEGSQIRDIVTTNVHRVELSLKYCPLPDNHETFLHHLTLGNREGANSSFGIVSDYFYYLNSPSDRERFKTLMAPLVVDGQSEPGFWANAASLCYVVVPHPMSETSTKNQSYTVVFFKSDLPGEFDNSAAKLYEGLSAQVIGILLKHELYIDESARAQRESERANIGAGMFHNLAHYILPLEVYGRSIRRFVQDGSYDEVIATAANIEDNVIRLKQFQAAVQRYVKHREGFRKGEIKSLEEIPGQALLIQTSAVHAASCWLSMDANAPVDKKYGALLCNLLSNGESLDFDKNRDRIELKAQLIAKRVAMQPPPSAPDTRALIHWWLRSFGVRISISGDFGQVRGDAPIVIGVVEELLLNALGAASEVFSQTGSFDESGSSPHVLVEAGVESDSTPAIFIKNWANTPLNKSQLFSEPKDDKGWGLYGMRLLMEKANGCLDTCDDSQIQKGRGPLIVGFKIIPVRG